MHGDLRICSGQGLARGGGRGGIARVSTAMLVCSIHAGSRDHRRTGEQSSGFRPDGREGDRKCQEPVERRRETALCVEVVCAVQILLSHPYQASF